MRIGISVNGTSADDVAVVVETERLGADTVWVAEAWGHDAMTPLAFLAAHTSTIRLATGIAQVGARTPAMLAMQAMSVHAMSGGRLLLGLGASGPRIMEGWHGVPFATPLAAMRDTIAIVRKVAAGERLEHDGRAYHVPLSGGRGIRSMAPPVTTPIPIAIASLGPRSLELTGEIADAWLGNAFMPEHAEAFLDPIRAGCERAGRSLADLELVIPVAVEFTDDVDEAGRRHAAGYAFTIGAMGAGSTNFYNAAFTRQGFGDDVEAVHRLWQDGRREAAAERVPIEIGMQTNLLGTPSMIAERLRRYRDAGVTSLQAKVAGSAQERIDTLAQLIDVAAEVSGEVTGGTS
jgi:F420-dependent oxidoreductase-like protein